MIRIYHTADLHDRRGFSRRLRALQDEAPGLLADSGDALRGSQTVFRRSEPISAEMNAAGYDVRAAGNREFHYLYACLRARAAAMQQPLVCSNLIDLRERPLPFARSLVVEHGGTRVHFLGLLVRQYPVGSRWERLFGWRFLPPEEVVEEYARAMKAGEMLVVLSHLGLRADRSLAQRVPRIDVILGGHSHDTLFEPEVVGGVPIVHAGPYGRYVSRTELDYDAASGRYRVRAFALVPLLGPP
jgi:2',3'-cyclic-nucleotide 2'-phosphodiesterase (5'-nucleotidase family)